MARARGLDSVGRLAASRERDAAKQLGEANQAVEAQKTQLKELQIYREEYQGKFDEANSHGVGVSRLQEYRAFMAKLDQAIIQVHENIIRCEQQSEQRRQGWLEKKGKTRAIDRLVERKNLQVREQEKTREQSHMDECGLRRKP